ncbi:Plasmodium vivax Vir protein, putative [Plasmodium vivax]|uniref:Vir protein, putative n=1 Tax=Plasmodium vivax TaxID=5855 RepID=A0A1G4E5E9_PLAVI|nr:Plasmodium vivax Vir protein, putative [Plasmodium vivax]
MGCNPTIKDDSYKFFDVIENYIKKADDAKQNDETMEINSNCEGFYKTMRSSFEDKEIAISVCKQLIKLYKLLDKFKGKSKCSDDYKNDCEFFNYWVNFKITKSRSNEYHCVSDLYNAIESQCHSDFNNMLDPSVIYDIDKDELDKMNILYSLYEKYSKLKTIIKDTSDQKKQVLTLSTECCAEYIQAKYICNGDSNNKSKFCEKLDKFKTNYDNLYREVEGKGSDFSDNFMTLSNCPNSKIITTAVTGSVIGLIPLFGVLYKFTPMGQMFRSKIGILNNNISNNDEDMTKMSLMDQENEQFRFQQGTYNIKYQSL